VSERPSTRGSVLTTSGFDYWPEAALRAVHQSDLLMRTWGDGYGYALVATGRAEAMVDPVAAPYDLAPMPVILAEAGGRFSDWSGEDRIDGGNGLATNGTVHDDVLALLAG
jgi:histidinol-phosphatase